LAEPGAGDVGEYASSSETEESDRDCKEGEVVEEDHGKQTRECKFEQECGEAREGDGC